MTNQRRRQAEASTPFPKATSRVESQAHSILNNENSTVRDFVLASGLLRVSPVAVLT